MSKKILITQLRHLVKNPTPTAKSLLSEEEYDYLNIICPNWESSEKYKLAAVFFTPDELPLVNMIIEKLNPLEMKIAKIQVVEAERRGMHPGSVSFEGAEALKRLMVNGDRENDHV